MFRFWLNHHQGACSLCFAKLLNWYQLIYWVIKIVRSCGRMLTFILLMWRIRRAPNSIPIYSYIQQDATLHSLFISENCYTCFGWYFHPSSGAHTTVSTASVICHNTVTAIFIKGSQKFISILSISLDRYGWISVQMLSASYGSENMSSAKSGTVKAIVYGST
jgi:hypothetical protein